MKGIRMKLTDNALRVLERRYLRKDSTGKIIETPNQMFHRVAENIANAERNYGKSEKQIKEIEEHTDKVWERYRSCYIK